MNDMIKKEDRGSWVIGGTTLMGVGAGFIFFQQSVFLFIACILIGMGLGLVIAPIISHK